MIVNESVDVSTEATLALAQPLVKSRINLTGAFTNLQSQNCRIKIPRVYTSERLDGKMLIRFIYSNISNFGVTPPL